MHITVWQTDAIKMHDTRYCTSVFPTHSLETIKFTTPTQEMAKKSLLLGQTPLNHFHSHLRLVFAFNYSNGQLPVPLSVVFFFFLSFPPESLPAVNFLSVNFYELSRPSFSYLVGHFHLERFRCCFFFR